jgi:uncharacterized protein YaeQ
MVRVLAFALYASNSLGFTKGLCADDEPELWGKNLIEGIELWISLGQVDNKLIKKSLRCSKQVVIFTYAESKSLTWRKHDQAIHEKNAKRQINIIHSF